MVFEERIKNTIGFQLNKNHYVIKAPIKGFFIRSSVDLKIDCKNSFIVIFIYYLTYIHGTLYVFNTPKICVLETKSIFFDYDILFYQA